MVRNTIAFRPGVGSAATNTPAEVRVPSSNAVLAHDVRSVSMSQMVQEVTEDVRDLEAFYNCNMSHTRTERLKAYFSDKLSELDEARFYILDQQSKVDYVLLRQYLQSQLKGLGAFNSNRENMAPIIQPFADRLVELLERRQMVTPTDGKYAARALSDICCSIRSRGTEIMEGKLNGRSSRFAAYQAANELRAMIPLLQEWYGFYRGYDPSFTWWVSAPYEEAEKQLGRFVAIVREQLVGINADEDDAIVGQPVGREGIFADLDTHFIAYSPEELIQLAEKEYAWCEAEIKLASGEMGYADDWKAALEHVKGMYVGPGEQTHLVHDLAEEAVAYVKKHDMITIPKVAEECWRTFMMTPERQKVNPFFLGGRSIIVSYPTDTMSHEDKLMSMRGNCRPFSRSTVFHELIPGHHLQFHMIARHRSYRSLFETPFWMEGWAFYWEFILWDRGFAGTPEEKIGMLFWRMHRCARIVFSLRFHLGELTPQECIDYLVEKVGHERATAEGEVRRSFNGDYSPLYQAGYMLGALQFYALRKEVVHEGGLSEKAFHDWVLRQGEMPIEMLRALLQNRALKPDQEAGWRFYDL